MVAGCDASAKNEGAPAPVEPSATSRALESCSQTGDCLDGLRCVQNACVSIERSRVGDQLSAAGRAALGKGNIAEAIELYQQSLGHYEKDALEPPAELFCEQGRALAAARMDPQKAEAAARVLHRCLLMTPPGSSMSRSAHDELAKLMEVGLDPQLLSRSEPADLYITLEPKRPSLDKLALTVTGDSKNRRKSHEAAIQALSAEDAKAQYAACWEAYWQATQQKTLTVKLPVSYYFILDEDDASGDRAVLEVKDAVTPPEAALATAHSCIQSTVIERIQAVAKSQREDTRWKADVEIRIGY